MRIDFASVLKAGAVAVAINIILGILGAIPLLGPIFWVCTCFGGILVPVGAGLLYGYFAPGKEDMGQAAAGGALAGVAAGLVHGIMSLVTTAVVALQLFGSFCGSFIFGGILGAVGGVLWIFFQGRGK